MKTSVKKLVSVKNLHFKYNRETVLSDITFDIYKGRNVAILGRNGGGKSTLIKVMLGYLKKTSGNVEFFISKNKIGYLPQIREFDASFPITIYELVISGLSSRKNLFRKFNKKEREEAENLLKEFDIYLLKDKLIGEVSGGQLQRALIARALISSPDIIFLDEPESFLDKEFEFQLFEKIRKLSDSTVVIISHEPEKIYDYIDTVFVVEGNIEVFEDKNKFYNKNLNVHRH